MDVTQAVPDAGATRCPRDTILHGDALSLLRTLPSESVQCCVTSPPYWALRDYGTAQWEGGDQDCLHRVGNQVRDHKAPLAITSGVRPGVDASRCLTCGARRIDAQLGLEATPDEYVARMVEVFREVKRVLRNDGVAWVNMGDSYLAQQGEGFNGNKRLDKANRSIRVKRPAGLKAKDLIGMPWRLAFALQADGWWLRADIIWHKPNPMPESVSDRPTKAHEYIFLLSKRATYYYDAEAIRESALHAGKYVRTNGNQDMDAGYDGHRTRDGLRRGVIVGDARNKRSVWTVATAPFAQAHFATFPPKLIEPCVLAGSASKACEHCGAPWRRVVETTYQPHGESANAQRKTTHGARSQGDLDLGKFRPQEMKYGRATRIDTTIGSQPTCRCAGNTGSARSVVLDPFTGAGTVGVVCRRHSRHYLGIELNAAYVAMAEERIANEVQPVLWTAQEAG